MIDGFLFLRVCKAINILQEEIRKIKNEESDSGRPSTEVLPFYTNKGTKCDEEQGEILGNNVVEGKAKASSTAFLVNPNHEIDDSPVIPKLHVKLPIGKAESEDRIRTTAILISGQIFQDKNKDIPLIVFFFPSLFYVNLLILHEFCFSIVKNITKISILFTAFQPCKYSAKARGKAGATKRPGLSFDPFVTRVPRTEHGRHRRSLNSDENYQTLKNRPKPLSGSTLNNNRRKWTQELHAKFVEALNFLGSHEGPKHKMVIPISELFLYIRYFQCFGC